MTLIHYEFGWCILVLSEKPGGSLRRLTSYAVKQLMRYDRCLLTLKGKENAK